MLIIRPSLLRPNPQQGREEDRRVPGWKLPDNLIFDDLGQFAHRDKLLENGVGWRNIQANLRHIFVDLPEKQE